jgi:hypothetical protein
MIKGCLFMLIFSTAILGCKKNDTIGKDELPIEVSVKVVDALCANIILEIQDAAFKYLGNSKFEHNGSVYSGAILIDRAHCLSANQLKNIYDENGVKKNNIFKVRLLKNATPTNCTNGTCTATFGKAPTKVFYIQ